jgi:hypothetical protein
LDIKPFSQPRPDFWASLEPFSVVFLGIAALLIVGIVIVAFFENWRGIAFPLSIAAFMFGLVGGACGAADMQKKHIENYNNAVSELKGSLTDDGFKIISGKPDLKPNAQSSMLLSYKGNNFDCTMFSPEDVNTSIVFSCGEAKLTLAQVKDK